MSARATATRLGKAREAAANASRGRSDMPILRMIGTVVRLTKRHFNVLVDIGCGRGDLREQLSPFVDTYVGCDLVRYEGFPPGIELRLADLNGRFPFDDASTDLVVSAETIEHLENPRAFLREIARIAMPGALIVVTTPNQLSILSKGCLVLKNHFAAFQASDYPAHITPVLESELLLIASEVGLQSARIVYTDSGRIPGTARHWPSRWRGRPFSDNLALIACKP
jgi:2-polyprenyl-3-methyl-5-hydroxy-6-metoxy-1,4-benzoquinol methylase